MTRIHVGCVGAVTVLAAGAVGPTAGVAQDEQPASSATCLSITGAVIDCPWGILGAGGATEGTSGGGGSSGSGGSGGTPLYRPAPKIIDPPDGGPACITTIYVPLAPGEPYPEDPFMNDYGITLASGQTVLPCPPQAQAPAQQAASYAIEGWEEVPLPVPEPHIAPGWAITGKWAFLETRSQTSFSHQTPTPVGLLEIDAAGVYHVDWGDGTTTGPHPSEGGPWPGGQIRHIYTHVGHYDVVVTERWTATWQLGPWSGQLSQLQTVGTIEDFEVRQIQAVVVSG